MKDLEQPSVNAEHEQEQARPSNDLEGNGQPRNEDNEPAVRDQSDQVIEMCKQSIDHEKEKWARASDYIREANALVRKTFEELNKDNPTFKTQILKLMMPQVNRAKYQVRSTQALGVYFDSCLFRVRTGV